MNKLLFAVITTATILATAQAQAYTYEYYMDGARVAYPVTEACDKLVSGRRIFTSKFIKDQLLTVSHRVCGFRYVGSIDYYERTHTKIPAIYGNFFSTYNIKQKYAYLCEGGRCR